RPDAFGTAIRTYDSLTAWLAGRPGTELAEPFTYVVDASGGLRLAPRRSEHVVCAGGEAVLGAGEIAFTRTADGWRVDEISNQSTGYCPAPGCWPAVAAALDRAGIPRPDAFTHPIVFRRCPACGERNL